MRLLFVFLLLSMGCTAQSFPKEWIGKYSGVMDLYNGEAHRTVAVSFEMKEITKDTSWTYLMIFSENGKETIRKDYLLKRKGTGWVFELDEKDGIVIETRLMGETFYDFFESYGMFFASRLSKGKGGLEFEIFGGTKSDVRVTSSGAGTEDYTEVYSYPPSFSQRVLLKKTKK